MARQTTYRAQEILDKIPDDWSQITFDFYLNKLMKIKIEQSEDPVVIMENNLQLIALFLDMPVEIVEQFPMTIIKQINTRLDFLAQKPKVAKTSKLKWIENMNEPTYDDFITFIKISEQLAKGELDNFPLLIKIVLKDKLSDDQILQIKMPEIEYGFFLLRKFSMKSLKSTIQGLQAKIIVQRTNEMMDQLAVVEGTNFKKKLKILRENYKRLTDFTS